MRGFALFLTLLLLTGTALADEIHDLAEMGRLDGVKKLVGKNRKLADLPNKRGDTPLICACFQGHVPVIEFLLKKGAKVNHKGGGGFTALHRAAMAGHLKAAEALIKAGADVNATNDSGDTALKMADGWGKPKMAELLKKHGAK